MSGRCVEPAPLRLAYRLQELSSAWERAGLAGLLGLAQAWPPDQPGALRLLEAGPAGASFLLDRKGLEALLELPGAAGAERCGEMPGRPGPGAAFVAALEPGAGGSGPWTRLWLDGLRAQRAMSGRTARSLAAVWSALGQDLGLELPAGSTPGADGPSRDGASVRVPASRWLLAHLWPLVSRVYQLRRRRSWGGKPDLDGFLWAVPDILDLQAFCAAFPAAMRGRAQDPAGRPREALAELGCHDPAGPRPREALLDHPAEAGLEYARRLAAAPAALLAVEVQHGRLQGPGLRVLAGFRLEPDAGLLADYGAFRALGYRDPGFRRIAIANLLEGNPWHSGFQAVLDPPGGLRGPLWAEPFRRDVRLAFRVAAAGADAGGLANLLWELVRSRILGELQADGGLSLEAAQADQTVMAAFQERRHSAALALFGDARQRRGPAFAAFLAGAILAGARPLSPGERERLRHALDRCPGQVRTLTLLALVAAA